MIAILTSANEDDGSDRVMGWLRRWGVPVCRINGDEIVHLRASIQNDLSRCSTCLSGAPVDLANITAVWFWRWSYTPHRYHRVIKRSLQQGTARAFNRASIRAHMDRERAALADYLFYALRGVPALGAPDKGYRSKLEILAIARECGLDVPHTALISDPRDVDTSFHGMPVITKPAGERFFGMINGKLHTVYTASTSVVELQQRGWQGRFPSVFQERLNKQYDVRTVYLDGECHSAAIFSQGQTRTEVDWRRCDLTNVPRHVPYLLPDCVIAGVRRLMDRIGLSFGSIDFVRTVDGRDVFLEVNPTGIFSSTSQLCNFHLEEKLAAALRERHEHRNN